MANFSVNQARHLYVAKTVKASGNVASSDAAGTINVSTVNAKDGTFYFQYKGASTLMRSDIISKDNIICAKVVDANDASQKTPLKVATVKLNPAVLADGKPLAGKDYLLRIVIRQFAGMSDEDTYIKHGLVHTYTGMTAADFYKTLAKSLAVNFSRELTPMFKFSVITETTNEGTTTVTLTEVTASTDLSTLTGSYVGIQIEELEQEDWVLGVRPQTTVQFEVYTPTIELSDGEVAWGDIKVADGEVTLNNGKKIADLEYFCMGERGDIYRNVGWPNVIPTTYMVDPTQAYYILEVHYAYVGPNEGPQRSEKDIEIVCSNKTEMNKLITKFNTASGLSIASLT